jgi:hypothetical protein
MKKISLLLMMFIAFSSIGQDVIYNFNSSTDGITHGGFPNLAATNGVLSTGDATTFTGGFQAIRTPDGLNLLEANYKILRLVVENSTSNTEWQLLNYKNGSTSGATAGGTDVAIPTVVAGSGFTTMDIAIEPNTDATLPTNNGKIYRLGFRAKQAGSFDWSGGGELKIAQMAIIDTRYLVNPNFEASSNWTASGPDVSGGYTTADPQEGSQSGTLTFNQDYTTGGNYLDSDIADFGKTVSPSSIRTTFYAKSTRAGLNVQVVLYLYDNLGALISTNFGEKEEITVADTWQAISLNRSLTDSFNQIQIRLRVRHQELSPLSGDVVSFDNVNPEFVTLDTSNSWTGGSDTSWTNTANWTNGVVPSSTLESDVQVSTNNPIISGSTSATVSNLEVDSGASLTINAGGSLIVSGTSSGNVTYNRTLTSKAADADGWHLIASPVAGQTYNNAYATTNGLATSTTDGTRRGLATFNDANDPKFDYLLTDDSNAGTFTSGIGYSAKIASTGTVAFTGTINTSDVNGVSVSAAADEFVLLGVPYTSYMSSQTFLAANTNLDQTQIWVWEQGVTGGNYIVGTALADNFILAPGQGFFVKKANTGATVNFAESNQQSNADTFKKSSRTEVKLLMNDGENNRFAKLYYVNNVTKGFDAGWEGETFGGIKNSIDVFSQLVENNQGKNYQVQSLPISEIESTIVPLGLRAAANKEITFSVEALNLPNGIKVFLEDRENNVFTNLDEGNYKITLTEATDGVGRFFLHTKSGALSTESLDLENISIYKANAPTLRIVGLQQGKTSVKLYNVLGKQIMSSSFQTSGLKDIPLPNLAKGVYIVQLETGASKLNKKIILE